VRDVREGAPAWNGGIRDGDIVTGVNGVIAANRSEFRRLMDRVKPGDVLKLSIRRKPSSKPSTSSGHPTAAAIAGITMTVTAPTDGRDTNRDSSPTPTTTNSDTIIECTIEVAAHEMPFDQVRKLLDDIAACDVVINQLQEQHKLQQQLEMERRNRVCRDITPTSSFQYNLMAVSLSLFADVNSHPHQVVVEVWSA
jgi:uncharacterized protein YqfB (UPF0267 family)